MARFKFNAIDAFMRLRQWNASRARLDFFARTQDLGHLRKKLFSPDSPPLFTEEMVKATVSQGFYEALMAGKLPPPEDPEGDAAFSKNVKRRSDAAAKELGTIRHRFYPDQILQEDSRWPRYLRAVKECLDQHFPPFYSFKTFERELDAYNESMLFLVSGYANAEDLEEMSQRVDFFAFWSDTFKIPEAPEAPPKADRTPARVQTYLRQLRDARERWVERLARQILEQHPPRPTGVNSAHVVTKTPDDGRHRRSLPPSTLPPLFTLDGRELRWGNGKPVELTKTEFNIVKRFDGGTQKRVPIADLMKGNAWKGIYRETRKEAIQTALRRLSTKLFTKGGACVVFALEESPDGNMQVVLRQN